MANTLTSSLIVRLIDQVTGPARQVSNSLLGLQRGPGSFGTRLNAAIDRNNAALDRSRGRLFDAAAGFFALKAAISSPIQAAMNFESAMADVNKVVDFETPEAMQAFKDELLALSRVVPQSVNGLAQIAAAAGQAGIAGDDLIRFTETAAKIGTAFDISAEESGEAMAKLMTGLGLSIDEVTLLSDAMNHLSNSQASSASEILDVVRRVGAQAQLFGYTATETSAFASAMIAAGAQSEIASTSFRNMGNALTRGASATTRQKDALEELGLDATDVARRMQEDAVATTIDVLERLSELPNEMRAAVSSDLFGNEARALGPLLTNLDLVRSSLRLVGDESDYAGSAFREFEVRAGTFENRLQTFTNVLENLKIKIGNALIPALTDLMNAIAPVVDRLAAFADAHPEIIRNVIMAAAGVVAFKVATAGLTFIGLLGRGGALSLLALGFNTVGKAAIGAAKGAKGMLAYQTALAGMSGAKLGTLGKIRAGLSGIALAVPGIAPLSGFLTAIGGALATISAPAWGLVAAGVVLVAGAGALLWKYWDRVTSVLGGVVARIGEELQPAIEAVRPVLDAFAPVVSSLGDAFNAAGEAISGFMDWLGSFFQQEVLSEEEKAAWGEAGYDVADRFINAIKEAVRGLLDWFTGLPGMIIDAIGQIDLTGVFKLPDIGAWAQSINPFGGGEAPAPANDNVSGHRAGGGPVWPSSSFLVGESEPEVFTPSTSGRITPLGAIEAKLDRIASASAAGSERRSGPASITIGDIIVQGASDPEETARIVRNKLRDEIDALLRGANADMGARA